MAAQEPGVIGRNMRRLREARGLSGNALAKAAGLRQSQVWDLESGRRDNPTVNVLAAIAQALECGVGDLLGDAGTRAGGV